MTRVILIPEIDDSTYSTVAAFLNSLKIDFSDNGEDKKIKNDSWGYITHLGFLAGDILRNKDYPEETVMVLDDIHVSYDGVSTSLSNATANVKSNHGEKVHRGYSGRNHWTFDGETLEKRGRRLGLK